MGIISCTSDKIKEDIVDYPNKDQILELQEKHYSERIGKRYGDLEVLDVSYDWEKRKQLWHMRCVLCGKERWTYNGNEYQKGKNSGICRCRQERARKEKDAQKIAAAQKRADEAPDNPKWIGQTFGTWEIIKYEKQKGMKVKCLLCGEYKTRSLNKLRNGTAEKCLCQFDYGKYKGEEWVGKRYGHLTITGYSDRHFDCVCDCGNATHVKPTFLFDGSVKTCGAECKYHLENCITHGMSRERLYNIWKGMHARCYNKRSVGYKTYGGRGISICDEWREDLFAFVEWAKKHGYADDLTIDRIDPNGNYEPSNCRWATWEEQANNQNPKWTFTPRHSWKKKKVKTVEIDGVSKSIDEWCCEYGVSRPFVDYRMKKKGMPLYEALTTEKFTDGRPTKTNKEAR